MLQTLIAGRSASEADPPMNDSLAPIVLFVYQRPDYTRLTLESLRANPLASESRLYIYADGPKENASENTLAKIAEVRRIIRSEQWCGEVEVIEHEKNHGLAPSIIEGVTEIVNRYGKVIVIEDDLALSPGFLQFMNDSLRVYADQHRVMHINGYMLPVNGQTPETALSQYACAWGWATWSRAWNQFKPSYHDLIQQLVESGKKRIYTLDGAYPYDMLLRESYEGFFDSWFVRWYAQIVLADGLTLFPGKSMVRNVGVDDTGTNCYENDKYDVPNLASEIRVDVLPIEENLNLRRQFKRFLINIDLSPRQRFKYRLLGMLPPKVFAFLKDLFRPNGPLRRRELKRLDLAPPRSKTSVKLWGKTFVVSNPQQFAADYRLVFEQKRLLFNSENQTPTIVECGASDGLTILSYLNRFPKAQVTAFEANPITFDSLKLNLTAFGAMQVNVTNAGLWDSNAQLTLISEGMGAGRIARPTEKHDLFQAKMLDAATELNRPIDLLRINQPGAETVILRRAADQLKNVQRICLHYYSLLNETQTLDEILNILRQNRFRVYIDQPVDTESPFLRRKHVAQTDLMAVVYAYKV